jgi:hypothetical protein
MIGLIRVFVASILTLVLAGFFVRQVLDFQARGDLDGIEMVLAAIAVVGIHFLLWGLGQERPWSEWPMRMAVWAFAVWFVGCGLAFKAEAHSPYARFGPYLVMAISGMWLMFLAWSSFWSLTWMGRAMFLMILVLLQAVFPVRYRVYQVNDQGELRVALRGEDSPAVNPPPSAPAQNAQAVPAGHLISKPSEISQWDLNAGVDTRAQIATGSIPNSYRVTIQGKSGQNPWEIQLVRTGFSVFSNQDLTVSFRAKSDQPRRMVVALGEAHPGWENLGLHQQVELTPSWTHYTFLAKAKKSDPEGRLMFDLGGSLVAVELADVQVSPPPSPSHGPGPAIHANPSGQGPLAPEVNPPPLPSSTTPPMPPSAKSTAASPTEPSANSTTPPSNADQPSAPAEPGDLGGWSFVADDGSRGSVRSMEEAETYLRVQVEGETAADDWRLRLERTDIPLQEGQPYEVHFRARSSVARKIGVVMTASDPPFAGRGLFEQVALEPTWKDYKLPFAASSSGKSRLYFALAGISADVDLAQMKVVPKGTP